MDNNERPKTTRLQMPDGYIVALEPVAEWSPEGGMVYSEPLLHEYGRHRFWSGFWFGVSVACFGWAIGAIIGWWLFG